VLLALLIGAVVVGAATHWGDDDRGPRVVQVTSPSGDTTGTQVVEVHDREWRRGGFPGFFLVPLLFVVLIVWLFIALFRRGGPGGPWRGHWDERFREWHREQHAGDTPPPPAATA
jgi:hypothetical protein